MNKPDTMADTLCPYCGSVGMQEWVPVPINSAQVAGIEEMHYLPGAIKCTNEDCPGPSMQYGHAWSGSDAGPDAVQAFIDPDLKGKS